MSGWSDFIGWIRRMWSEKKEPEKWHRGKKAPCQRCEVEIEQKIPSHKYCCRCNGDVCRERLKVKQRMDRVKVLVRDV